MLAVAIVAIVLIFLEVWVLRSECTSGHWSVWLVDDREENLDTFRKDHGREFDVRTFSRPEDVLNALKEGAHRPDALLCDIYFYDNPDEREEIENKVHEHTQHLQDLAEGDLGAKHARGIELIEKVHALYGDGLTFPIYAYTSKGPYLLQGNGFTRLEYCGVQWLFKKRYQSASEVESYRITKDIANFRYRRSWKQVRGIIAVTGLVSAVLGVLLDRIAKLLGY
jgi:hypothetical protein